jgi:predicted ribosome-associated RNA-binding protein Tma20
MEELRRTAVGNITEAKCHTMQELTDAVHFHKKGDSARLEAMFDPPETYIELPKAFIKESALASVLSGAQVMAPGLESMDDSVIEGGRVAIYCNETFLGVSIAATTMAKIRSGEAHSGIAIKLERIQKP